MKSIAAILMLCASLVFAQSKVDQGKPGTQGPWPVTGITTLSDGGIVYLQTTLAGVADPGNSSTTPLGGGATFTGVWRDVKDYSVITVSVISNVASAASGMKFQWSPDGINADKVESINILAATARAVPFNIRARYFRVVYTNGLAAQAYFRLGTTLHASGNGMNNYPLLGTLTDDSFAVLTRSVLVGTSAKGVYTNVGVDPTDGDLLVSTGIATWPTDGGYPINTSSVYASPYICSSTSRETSYVMDGGAITIGTLNPRVYIVACNTSDNTTGVVRCRADGTAPIIDAGAPGTVLAVGACVPYSNPGGRAVKCIGTSNYVSAYECGP